MRRSISSFLVPLLLLPGLAHAHAGQSFHDPAGVDHSPHIHLRVLLPWLRQPVSEESSGSRDRRLRAPVDQHDADALYLSDSVLSGRLAPKAVAPVDSGAMMSAASVSVRMPIALRTSEVGARPAIVQSLPIYLLASALLI